MRDQWRKQKLRGKNIGIDAINPSEAAVADSSERSAQRLVIEQALDQLKKEERMVVELRILKGYSVAETAEILNKQEGNIRVIQHRALQKLAEILKPKMESWGEADG
ncbi:RNA polymerase sigma factor [Caldibacillus debilis]|uniref:RNA polymerase sigma factor, sigma-70 family n=2 Tax=Caldibacillus debilis TaxID=301148 RepID=A0A420VG97_9BACI|nr:sigma-70 family RNA polymerase sigma factor [Caldibacillus debilis]RKO62674.1 RNA polymerase sigma factor, sigma-70 family [Caldibacillus debilis GB1]